MAGASTTLLSGLNALLPDLRELYKDLHSHPELSFQEVRTAGIVAERLRGQGWNVTENVGGTGVVAVTHGIAADANADADDAPVVLLRADMDALPVREGTGLPYASRVVGVDASGREVPVMHACGHDVHVACLLGATGLLAAHRDRWRGTVVAVFQPGEEVGGARRMIEDGFLDRFPRARVCLAQHVAPAPTGTAAIRAGAIMSASDTLNIRIHGRGGHGATPEAAVDPVVAAAATVMRLQTVVSREVAAAESAVVTVGALHAGTKANVIAEYADLAISVRTTSEPVRARVLAAIERIVRAEAAASGAEREPEIHQAESLPLTVNDPVSTETVHAALAGVLGDGAVLTLPAPSAESEDFGTFGDALDAPSVFWHFGGLDSGLFTARDLAALRERGVPETVPGCHSPRFAPVLDPTLEIGVKLMAAAAAAWLTDGAPFPFR